ncbi:MAG: acyl-CoA dehydrogenase family protein [Acidimicrobiales bacterium]
MRLAYDRAAERFRADLETWLDQHAPSAELMAEPKLSSAHVPDWARQWQRTLFEHGWLVPGWPPELGGRNASSVEQLIYFEELSRRRLPRSMNPQGLSICAPSLLDHGTDEQKARWVLPTLRADITWCLGMSEPGAGSDLAGLQTRATLEGDAFVVNGQKVWTSGAHHADWCMCFVRTDPSVPRHGGISALVIDMKSSGIVCRPLPDLTDPHAADFNEVFFSDVVVPRHHLLGQLNQGWRITQGSLAHERSMLWIANAMTIQRALESLVAAGVEHGLGDDALFRDRVASLWIDGEALRLLGYRGFAKAAEGHTADELMLLKMFSSEIEQQIYYTGLEALGPDGADLGLDSGVASWRAGSWAIQWLHSFAGTIAGGTSQIQRNIIAERVLGLPRERVP